MPLIGALVPGVISTGVKTPEVPFFGDSFHATRAGVRITHPSGGQAIICAIYRNGVLLVTLTIPAGNDHAYLPISQQVNNGDYFHVNLTQVGTPPNEGTALVWVVSGTY